MKRTKKRMILCMLLLVAVLFFIWGNSLASGETSGNLSGKIMQWINTVLRLDEAGADILHRIVRKVSQSRRR